MIKRQLPAYSPLDLGSIAGAALSLLAGPGKAREALASLLSTRYLCNEVVLTGSGTQALELAIRLAVGSGREGSPVALPAYSCFDVATAAVGADVPVLFYDLDPGTLAPDMEGIQAALSDGAGAVVVANLYGFPVDWDAIQSCCREAGAVIIEDVAQGLGSTWAGKPAGTFGDLTVLSFGRGKGWTGGGGGALLVRTRDPRVTEEVQRIDLPAPWGDGLRAAGLAVAQWGLGRPSLYGLPSALPGLALGQTLYREPEPMRNISSFSAALAVSTAAASSEEIEIRKGNAVELERRLSESEIKVPVSLIRPLAGGVSSYLRFPVLVDSCAPETFDREEARSIGVMRGYPRPLPDLPAINDLARGQAEMFPGAGDLAKFLIAFPTHSMVTEAELDALPNRLFSSPRSGP